MNLLGPSTNPTRTHVKAPEPYTDTMKRALNLTVEQNILPNWRQPRTLQYWSSMNYPSHLMDYKSMSRDQKRQRNPPSVMRPLTSLIHKQKQSLPSIMPKAPDLPSNERKTVDSYEIKLKNVHE